MTDPVVEVTVTASLPDGRADLRATAGGRVIHQDAVVLASADERERFAARVVEVAPALDRGDVLQRVESLAAVPVVWRAPASATPRATVERGPIKLHRAADLAALPPVQWAVKGILPRSGVAFVFGQPGSGKSFLAVDVAFHVALGLPWCGRKVRQGPVLILSGEGQAGLPQRVKAWSIGNGRSLESAPVKFGLETPAIATADGQARMRAAIGDVQPAPVLVVVDTLAQALPGSDENSAQEVGPALSFLAGVARDLDLCVLVVHHERKAADIEGLAAMRGSSALAGAADTALRVRRDKGRLKVESVKQKDGASDSVLELRMESVCVGEDEDGDVLLVPYLRPATPAERQAEHGDDATRFRERFATTFGSEGASGADLDAVARGWGLTRDRSRELRLEAARQAGWLVRERVGNGARFRLRPSSPSSSASAGETAPPPETLAAAAEPRVPRRGETSDSLADPRRPTPRDGEEAAGGNLLEIPL